MTDELALKLRLPPGPQQYWRAMRDFGAGGYTITDVYMETRGVSREAVRKYLLGCLREGHIEQIGERPTTGKRDPEKLYRNVTRGARPPVLAMRAGDAGKRGQVHQHLWNAMRSLASFGLRELATAASTDELTISVATATRYVHQLRKAGAVIYVKDGGKAAPSVYRLKPSANAGPRCPRVLQAHLVFDPNKGRIVGEPVLSEVSQ